MVVGACAGAMVAVGGVVLLLWRARTTSGGVLCRGGHGGGGDRQPAQSATARAPNKVALMFSALSPASGLSSQHHDAAPHSDPRDAEAVAVGV